MTRRTALRLPTRLFVCGLALLACSTRKTPSATEPGAPSAGSGSTDPGGSGVILGHAGTHAAASDGESGGTGASDDASTFVLVGGTVFGLGKTNLSIAAGVVRAVGGTAPARMRTVDVSGRYIVPGFIDSHVHLAYDPAGEELLTNGIAAVLDLAAPLPALAVDHAPLVVVNSGPMLTAVAGYPLNSWGSAGYGLEVSSPEAAESAVARVVAAGARVIKVALTDAPTLDDATVKAIVVSAHARGLLVFSHALEEQSAARAAADGVDVLAHTPVESLSDATLAAWQGRTVISTLAAFGGGRVVVQNLRELRAHGVRVLYGTDFGNTFDRHIQAEEITLLMEAGLDGSSIVAAGTSEPSRFLGLRDLGSLEVGKRACFLVLEGDPSADPHVLSRPLAVYVDGKLVSASL